MGTLGCPRDCYDTCILRVDDNRLVNMEEFLTAGSTCGRAIMDYKHANSQYRIRYPLLAIDKKEELYKRVSLTKALKILVERLSETLKTHGPEKVLVLDYAGNRGMFTRLIPLRFWRLLGATFTDYNICDYSGINALRLHYGLGYGLLPEALLETRMIVYWGVNAAISNLHGFKLALKARSQRNAILATIDVRRSETMKLSDLKLKIAPGTDGLLALGVANYIIENELYDKDFIKRYTVGFEEFKKYVKNYPVDLVSRHTGLKPSLIEDFAHMYAINKPNIIFIGYGLQRRYGGGEIIRAISLLPALVGRHRGFYYSNTEGLKIPFNKITPVPASTIKQSAIGKLLEKGRYKFVFIFLTNPVATYPDSRKIRKGLLREDVFVAVHETHWSDTASVADLVIPAPTYLEKEDLVYSYWHNYLIYNRPVYDKPKESITEIELAARLAKIFEINDNFLEDPWSELKKLMGSTLSLVINNGYAKLPYHRLDEYQTPSGKIEFYSSVAEKKKFPPLPVPPLASERKEGFFLVVSGAHPLYIHTQFEDVYGKIPPIFIYV
ncbi:MAG: molybdopterin-dependent oxidoreductase [Desulfurococcales archaeon]|nr:molybdopterin-dependent oxidoreductase [Desulfurococcales archaeon]